MANCSECTYLNPDSPDLYGKYWCDRKLERVDANEAACYSFCKAYNRSSNVSKSYERFSKDNSNSPSCYLTTVLCEILKVENNNPFLNAMRNFRSNVLQKDDKYKALLVEYDIIGPEIAKNLINDPLKYQIAANAFGKYIKPITDLLKEKNYEKAIEMYVEMTNKLRDFYNIKTIVNWHQIENADIKCSGHGYYVKKIHIV